MFERTAYPFAFLQNYAARGVEYFTSPIPPKMALRFLDFPAEIREQVYRELLHTKNCQVPAQDIEDPPDYKYHTGILSANKQVHREATKILQDNIFIKITTPWPEAIQHIRSEGRVSTITTGDKAASFLDWHLWVYIDTPLLHQYHQRNASMLICLDDLEAFTRMWHFSNLNHFGLNQNLRLKLTVQDPHVPDRKIPKTLQSRLLLPFGAVKELHSFSVEGEKLLPSVQDALNKERLVPDPTPDESLAKGFTLHEEGEELLNAGKFHLALEKFVDSFAAIHITVSGRARQIHAEGYYIREVEKGKYKGFRADYVRMILRVQLVDSVIRVYMKLQEWTEAHFWGKRTILLFRSGITGEVSEDITDEDTQLWFMDHAWASNFPARREMGQIFFQVCIVSLLK